MEVYREILPNSYLLILADGLSDEEVPTDASAANDVLDRALRRAARSGKSSVWIDCADLQALPPNAAELLHYYHQKLRQHNMNMVLCHLSEALQLEVQSLSAAPPPMVATLLDAEQLCRPQVATAGPRAVFRMAS